MEKLERFAKLIEEGDVESVTALTEELLAEGVAPSR